MYNNKHSAVLIRQEQKKNKKNKPFLKDKRQKNMIIIVLNIAEQLP